MTFFRVKRLRISSESEGAHASYFSIPSFGGVFDPSALRERAITYSSIEEEAVRTAAFDLDPARKQAASQWMLHVNSPSSEILYSQLQTDDFERRAFCEAVLRWGNLPTVADDQEAFRVKAADFFEEAVRKGSPLYDLGASAQANGLLTISQPLRMAGAADVAALLYTARLSKTPLRIFYGFFHQLLIPLISSRKMHVSAGEMMLLTLLAQKLAPAALQDGVYGGSGRDVEILSKALLALSPKELELLLDELIEENFHFRMEIKPGHVLHWAPIQEADLGRLGPFTAHRLSMLIGDSLKDGWLEPARWDVLAQEFTRRFGAAPPETVRAAAIAAGHRGEDVDPRMGRRRVVQFLDRLNADYLRDHEVLVIPSRADKQQQGPAHVVQTLPSECKTYTLEGRAETIRVHTLDRFLAQPIEFVTGEAGASDLVIAPDALKEAYRRVQGLSIPTKEQNARLQELKAWKNFYLGQIKSEEDMRRYWLTALESEIRAAALLSILDEALFTDAPLSQQRTWATAPGIQDIRLGYPFVQTFATDPERESLDPETAKDNIEMFRQFNGWAISPDPALMLAEEFMIYFTASNIGHERQQLMALFPLAEQLDPSLNRYRAELADPVTQPLAMVRMSKFFRGKTNAEIRAAARILRRNHFTLWIDADGSVIRLHRPGEPTNAAIDQALSDLRKEIKPGDLGPLLESMIGEMLGLAREGRHAEVRALWRLMPMPLTPEAKGLIEDRVLEILGVPIKNPMERAIEDLQELNRDKNDNGWIIPAFLKTCIYNLERAVDEAAYRKALTIKFGASSLTINDLATVLQRYDLLLTPEKRAARRKLLVHELAAWLKRSFEAGRPLLEEEWPDFASRLNRLFPEAVNAVSAEVAKISGSAAWPSWKQRDAVFELLSVLNNAIGPVGWLIGVSTDLSGPELAWNVKPLAVKAVENKQTMIMGKNEASVFRYQMQEATPEESYAKWFVGSAAHLETEESAIMDSLEITKRLTTFGSKRPYAPLAEPWILKGLKSNAPDIVDVKKKEQRLFDGVTVAAEYFTRWEFEALPEDKQELFKAQTDPYDIPVMAFVASALRPESDLDQVDKEYPDSPALRYLNAFRLLRIYDVLQTMALSNHAGQNLGRSLTVEFLRNTGEPLNPKQLLLLVLFGRAHGMPLPTPLEALRTGLSAAEIKNISDTLVALDDTTLKNYAQDIQNSNYLISAQIQGKTLTMTRRPADSPVPLRPALETELKAVVEGLLKDGHMDPRRFGRLTEALQRALGVPPITFPEELTSGPLAGQRLVEIRRFLRRWNDDYLSEHGYVVRPWLQASGRKADRSVLKATVTPLIRNARQTVRVSGDSKVGSHFRHTIYDDGRATEEGGLQSGYVGVLQDKAGSDEDEAVVRRQVILMSLRQVAEDLSFAESRNDSPPVAFAKGHLETDSPIARWAVEAVDVKTPLGSGMNIPIMMSINAENLFSWYCLMASPGYAHLSADRIVDKVLSSANGTNPDPLSSSEIAFFGLLSEQMAALNPALIPFTVQEVRSPQAHKDRILQLRDYVRDMPAEVLEKLAIETITESCDLRFIVRSDTEIEIQNLPKKKKANAPPPPAAGGNPALSNAGPVTPPAPGSFEAQPATIRQVLEKSAIVYGKMTDSIVPPPVIALLADPHFLWDCIFEPEIGIKRLKENGLPEGTSVDEHLRDVPGYIGRLRAVAPKKDAASLRFVVMQPFIDAFANGVLNEEKFDAVLESLGLVFIPAIPQELRDAARDAALLPPKSRESYDAIHALIGQLNDLYLRPQGYVFSADQKIPTTLEDFSFAPIDGQGGETPPAAGLGLSSAGLPMSGEQLIKFSVDPRRIFNSLTGTLKNVSTDPTRITLDFLLALVQHPSPEEIRVRLTGGGVPENLPHYEELTRETSALVQEIVNLREEIKTSLNAEALQFLLAGFIEPMLQSGAIDFGKFEDLATTLEMLFAFSSGEQLMSATRAVADSAPDTRRSLAAIATFLNRLNAHFLHDLGYTLSVEGDKITVSRFSKAKRDENAPSPPKDLSADQATYLLMEIVLEKFWGRLTPEFVQTLAGIKSLNDLNQFLDRLGRKGEGIGLVEGKKRADIYAIVSRIAGEKAPGTEDAMFSPARGILGWLLLPYSAVEEGLHAGMAGLLGVPVEEVRIRPSASYVRSRWVKEHPRSWKSLLSRGIGPAVWVGTVMVWLVLTGGLGPAAEAPAVWQEVYRWWVIPAMIMSGLHAIGAAA